MSAGLSLCEKRGEAAPACPQHTGCPPTGVCGRGEEEGPLTGGILTPCGPTGAPEKMAVQAGLGRAEPSLQARPRAQAPVQDPNWGSLVSPAQTPGLLQTAPWHLGQVV